MVTPSVSVAVMAHPDRRAFVDELVTALHRVNTRVVWDQRGNEWDTGRRALLAYAPWATHHLVIQDDAIVCEDLVAGVTKALAHVPSDALLSLYLGRSTPFPHHVTALAARARGEAVSWLAIGGLYWGVAVVVPTALIGDLVAWCDRSATGIPNYDRLISRWLERRPARCWYTWPSLVDHRDAPSLLPGHGRRAPGRVAHEFLGTDRSALDVDWSRGVLHVRSLRNYAATHDADVERPQTEQENPMVKPEGMPHLDLMTPRKTVTLRMERRRYRIVAGETVAHRDSWIVRHKPHLWRQLVVHYPADTLDVAEPEPADLVSTHAFEQSPTGPEGNCWCGRPEGDEIHPVTTGDGPAPGTMVVDLIDGAPPAGGAVVVVDGEGTVDAEAVADAVMAAADAGSGPSAAEVADAYAEGRKITIEPEAAAAPAPKPPAKAVRAWAKEQGIEVPARGPLPDDVIERYVAAHQGTDW